MSLLSGGPRRSAETPDPIGALERENSALKARLTALTDEVSRN